MVWTNFNKLWSNLFHKEHATLVKNGKTAIFYALKHLNSKKVALPTYTCERVLQACLLAKVEPYIIDCNKNLQINLDTIPTEVDTVIIPHMFGIQSKIPKNKTYKIIEDCSQCIGLKDLGKYSDIVIASTGPTKWLNAGGDKENGGGIIAYNGINAGIDLIGKNQPNSWLRAMYFGPQKRIPYTPLHDLYPGFNCPIVDSYKNKLDWISIFP